MVCNFNNLVFAQLLLFLSVLSGISSNLCDLNVKMYRTLQNEGFHRNLTYEIKLNKDGSTLTGCWIGLDQVLPPGVLANPDELGELRRMERLTAIPKSKINVELPAEQSSASSVFLIGLVQAERSTHLWMPVHARYHQAGSGGGTARNEIGHPTLYIRCDSKALEKCDKLTTVTFLCNGHSKDRCIWKTLPYYMMTDTLTWHVPIGNTDHYYIVSIGTGLAVAIGSLYLLKIIHEYKIGLKRKMK